MSAALQAVDTVQGPTSRAPPAHSQSVMHIYRARRLRSNTRPPAIAATAPSPSARFAPVRGNCSPAMGSRVPSGAGAMLGLPGCPGAAVGCPGVDDAVGPAVGCGEVVGFIVGWADAVGLAVGPVLG